MRKMKRFLSAVLCVMLFMSLCACTVFDKTGQTGEDWTSTDNQTNVYFLGSTEKPSLTEQTTGNGANALYIDMVKNEKEGGQFVIRNNDAALEDVHAEISDLTNADGHVIRSKEYSRIGAEGTTENYVMIFRERYSKIEHVADTDTYYMPDALIPLYEDNNSAVVNQGENQGFYVSVKTMPDDPAGLYTGTVTLTHKNGTVTIPVYVTVHDVTLPEVSACKSLILNWSISDAYADTDIDTIEAKEMLMYFLLDNRMNIDWLPGSQGTWLDEYVATAEKHATDPRVQAFHMPFFGEVVTRDDGTQYYYINAQKTTEWRNAMDEIGVLDKCYYYQFDEIGTEDKYQLAKEMHQQLMEIDPNTKNLITLFSGTSQMYGNLSVWCTGRKGTKQSYIDTIYNTGTQEVWWYGTEERQIGLDNLIQAKSLFWTQKQLGIVGYLDWAVDCYTYFSPEEGYYGMFNWWDEVCQYVPDAGYSNYGGDSFMVYPGKENDGVVNRNLLVSSIRFETVRDGIEDYDLLTIREQQIQQQLDEKGITSKTAADFMNIYYDGMVNSVNLDTNTVYSETDRYAKLRALLIEDIETNKDVVVGLYTDSENLEKMSVRTIFVLAPENSTVQINGQTATWDGEVYTADIACMQAETTLNIQVAKPGAAEVEEYIYYAYPRVMTSSETILDMTIDGQQCADALDNPSVTYQDGRLHMDFSKAIGNAVSLMSTQWTGPVDWSKNQYLVLDVKNEGDTPITSLTLQVSGSRNVKVLDVPEIAPGERKTVYLDYITGGELGNNTNNIRRILFSADDDCILSIGYLSICSIDFQR